MDQLTKCIIIFTGQILNNMPVYPAANSRDDTFGLDTVDSPIPLVIDCNAFCLGWITNMLDTNNCRV